LARKASAPVSELGGQPQSDAATAHPASKAERRKARAAGRRRAREERRLRAAAPESDVAAEPDSSAIASSSPPEVRKRKGSAREQKGAQRQRKQVRRRQSNRHPDATPAHPATAAGEEGWSPASIVVRGEEEESAKLSAALTKAFENLRLGSLGGAERPQLVVVMPNASPGDLPKGAICCLVGSSATAEDGAAIRSAKAMGGVFVPTALIASRHRGEQVFDGAGHFSEEGPRILAIAIRDAVLGSEGFVCPAGGGPHRRVQHPGYSHPESPSQILKMIDWPGKSPAASLGAAFRADDLEQFIEGNICLATAEGGDAVPFRLPFNWDRPLDSRAATRLYGLAAVSNVLVYWLLRANRVPVRQAGHIEVLLKQRGIAASGLLAGAGAIILDFLRVEAGLPEQAWTLTAVRQRAIAFELFLLCCKAAVEKRIRFNESACAPVFDGLVQLLERLHGTAAIGGGTADGTAEAARLAAMALPLRHSADGARLLDEALEYLRCCHLEAGMSADGVWEDGILQHCAVLSSLRALAADLRVVQSSNSDILEAILKLARFVDLFVTPEGQSPAIAEQPSLDLKRPAAASRTLLRKAGGAAFRPANEGYLPQSGYFISRSGKTASKVTSHLVMLARPANKGGPSLSFSIAGLPMLIGGGTLDPKAPREVRRAALEDPASHNAVRINGRLYRDADPDPSKIRLAGTWREKDWAAARLVNEAFQGATVSRTVVHLRPSHGLLVVDEFAGSPDMLFEQFWHFAPELQPHGSPLFFSAGKRGILSVAFDGGEITGPSKGGDGPIGWTAKAKRNVVPNPYICCSTTSAKGIVAAFFGWGTTHVRVELQTTAIAGGWQSTMATPSFRAGFEFAEGRLSALG